jgi:hypothetical protein
MGDCMRYYQCKLILDMSTERNKNPLKRDQAINDATNGQLGEQSRSKPLDRGESPAPKTDKNIETELLARCLEICDANNTKSDETKQYTPGSYITPLPFFL